VNTRASAFPPIEALVPHRGSMLWLSRLVEGGERSVDAEALVPEGAWYGDERGCMPGWLGVELMAQALSAHVGLLGWLAGRPPRPGVLLGCRAYRGSAVDFPPGSALRINATLSYRDESGFGAYDCAIRLGDAEVARATLKVYEPGDFEAFLRSAAAP
jgi:predicted hotdog family 3-hydroxylacyl-ACP dehydratase